MGGAERFGSFVVQTRSERIGAGIRVSGVVENLGNGQRTRFGSPEELSRLIDQWATAQLEGGEKPC